MIVYRFIIVTLILFGLWGCGSNEQRVKKDFELVILQVDNSIKQLKKHLEAGRITNAKLLHTYAGEVKKINPEYNEIADILVQDASTSGPIFQSLQQRLDAAKGRLPQALSSPEQARLLMQELNAIHSAADTRNFNYALSDPVNVLAGMSGGKLSRVATPGQEASNSSTAPVGSELIGNPNYGQWQSNSSGDSFWEWYGKYALISNLFDLASSRSFSGWSSNRHSSYYHDYGREYYASPSQKANYQRTENRAKKQFSQQGKQFKSPYAKNGRANTSTGAQSVFKTPNKFKSPFSNSNKFTNNTGKIQGQSNSAYNYRSKKVNSRSFGFGGK